jgi:hypothetical protein
LDASMGCVIRVKSPATFFFISGFNSSFLFIAFSSY